MSETQQKPKILPNSINAEKLVLGCMLTDEYCTLDGIDLLSACAKQAYIQGDSYSFQKRNPD